MNSEALVQLALNALSCNQKALGVRLNVSPTQISKWKKGEHMSSDMEAKLRQLANIGDKDPEFVLSAGSLRDAEKWERLIAYLASRALEGAETGYVTEPLSEETPELLCLTTFDTLKEMGVTIPAAFPSELDLEYGRGFGDEGSIEDGEAIDAVLEENPYSNSIDKIYQSLNDVYGFYAAYVAELIEDDSLDLIGTPADNVEPCLIALAASKVKMDPKFAPNFKQFCQKTKQDYEGWLNLVKDKAFRAGVPLRVELLDLVYEPHDALGHEAEAESFGFNASRVHPDVYMNELLVGMRVIHQVLPAILKKLEIAEDFKLDQSRLRLGD